MFVISHRNRNICSSLYGIANGGKTRRKREDKRRGRRKEEKVYVYAEQRSSSITHTDDKKVIRQDM